MCLVAVYGPIFVPVPPKPLKICRSVWLEGEVSEREGGALRDLEESVPTLPCTQLPRGFDAVLHKRVIKRLQETLQENLEH